MSRVIIVEQFIVRPEINRIARSVLYFSQGKSHVISFINPCGNPGNIQRQRSVGRDDFHIFVRRIFPFAVRFALQPGIYCIGSVDTETALKCTACLIFLKEFFIPVPFPVKELDL